nr:hypothetical protein OJOKFFHK_00021 [uncultured bacterium]
MVLLLYLLPVAGFEFALPLGAVFLSATWDCDLSYYRLYADWRTLDNHHNIRSFGDWRHYIRGYLHSDGETGSSALPEMAAPIRHKVDMAIFFMES